MVVIVAILLMAAGGPPISAPYIALMEKKGLRPCDDRTGPGDVVGLDFFGLGR